MPLLLLTLSFLLLVPQGPALADPLKKGASIEEAVEALLGRMTLEEKIGQLNFPSQAFPRDKQLEDTKKGRIGGMLNVVHPDHVRQFAAAARASRLKIPLIFGIDAIYAFRTTFPPPIAWAATWRPSLAEAAAEAVAREASAVGVNLTFAPMVDVSRDPRWGRVIEGAGEDAFLGAAFAAARVKGYRKGGLATAAKHFVGYGAPEGGRDYNGTQISVSELHDRYLPPFLAAIEAGTESVMASFNTVNGVPVTADPHLLNGLLKRDLGFNGIVMSDFVAIGELMNHGVAGTLAEAARKAMLAGIDFDMAGEAYDRHLEQEVTAGRVPMAAIDAAVRRVLGVKFRLGLFDLESKDFDRLPRKVAQGPVRAAARAVARESFVLLKNDQDHLPISPETKTIALIGAAATSTSDHSWYGPAGYAAPETQTLLEAMRARLGPKQELHYAKAFADGCGRTFDDKDEAVRTARAADLIVFIVAEDCDAWGEGTSRANLGLSGVQQEMLEALADTGRPVVLVVETGRPLTLANADRHAAAILIAWHPGTEGRTALAEVLFGEVAPSGKLPMTFPRSVGQIPLSYNTLPTSRPSTGNRYTTGYVDEQLTPLYRFGYGLSYTQFDYSSLELSAARMRREGTIEVSVKVKNIGSRPGSEVVQLYTRQLVASRSRPVRELKGFAKISLAPAEEKTVHFRLTGKDLAYHDDDGRPVIEPGPFQVFVGGSSAADLSAPFEIVAD
jgi:beta-glucosidase